MSDKIKYTDIADKGLFDPIIKGAQDATKELEAFAVAQRAVLKESKQIAKLTPLETFEDVEKVERAILEAAEAVEKLNKAEKERNKLQKEIKKVNDQLAKEKAKQVKQLTDEEKLRKRLNKARSEEGRALAGLRLQIQEANREQKENARISGDLGPYKALSAQLNKLRNEYKDLASEEKANTKEAKELLVQITKLDKKLKDLDDSVGQNQRSVGSYVRALDTLSGKFKALQNLAVVGVLVQLVGVFRQSEEGAKAFDKAINVAIGSITLFISAIVNAFKGASDPFQFFDILKEEFDNFDERLKQVAESQTKLVDDTVDATRETAKFTNVIAEQTKQLKALDIAANDNTLSLQDQIKAEQEAITIREKIAEQEKKIADENLNLARDRRKASAELRADGKADASAELELAEARKASAEAQNNLLTVRAESAKRLREIERDQTELELDALLDGFDRRKTVNEAIIADETLSLKRRREALAENQRELKNSLEKELALLQANAKERIDIEDLLKEKDTQAFNEKLKQLELDEVLTKRQLEVINETRQAREDNRQSERDLKEAEQNTNQLEEEIKLLKELSKELEENAGNLKKQAKVRQENTIKTLEKEIELLNLRLETVDKTSNEGLAIQKEILEKEGELFDQRAAKQLEANKKVIDGVKQSAEVVAGLLSNINKKALSDIDRLIEGSETRLEQLREAAGEQAQSATENLALEEKRQAELQAKREKILKRQQREALILATIQSYTARLSSAESPAQALGATVRDTTFLRSFIESLPAFWEGAERVGDVLEPTMAGRDGHVVRVDGGERVVSTSLNNIIPSDMSNAELAMLAHTARARPSQSTDYNTERLGRGLKDIEQAIRSKPDYLGDSFDERTGLMVRTIKRHNRIERTHHKQGGIW